MLRGIVRNIHFFQRLAPTIGKRLRRKFIFGSDRCLWCWFRECRNAFSFRRRKKVYSLLKESIAPSFQMSLFGLSYDKPSAESFFLFFIPLFAFRCRCIFAYPGIQTNFLISSIISSCIYLKEEKRNRTVENPAWTPSSVIDFCRRYFRRELVTWSNINRLHCDAKQKWRHERPRCIYRSSILCARWVH